MSSYLANPRAFSTIVLFLFLLLSCDSEKDEPFLMGLGNGFNDVTLVVRDLASAVDYYRDTLGFDIYGNGSAGVFSQTMAASVGLGDMTSLEIVSVRDSAIQDSIPAFLSDYLKSREGIRFFSLKTSSVDSTFQSLISQGFQVDSVQEFRTSTEISHKWSRDDGNPQRKSLDFSKDNPSFYQPRFIQNTNTDYKKIRGDWNTYYIYTRQFRDHPNGVVGISAIKIATRDLESVADQYKQMGFAVVSDKNETAKIPVFRHQELHLVSAENDTAAAAFLRAGIDGVYSLRFDVINLDSTFQFYRNKLPDAAWIKTKNSLIIKANYAFGVQLEFIQEPEEQSILARKLTPADELDTLAMAHAADLYTKYCALCHGENREGYAADHAPSLRSKSLLATSMNNNFMRYTIQYGRANTAMAGYFNKQGGPLEYIEIELLLEYLQQKAGIEEPIELSRETVKGDIAMGAELYAKNCTTCHGEQGEGISAPALANPMLLATATDHFLRYAISEGRDGTPMIAFKESLSNAEIDALTAFLRSRASGWDIPEPDTITVPTPEEYVLNPDSAAPVFDLREGKYVSAKEVNSALKQGKRMIILDARSEVAWRQMHIPGAAPVPYYEEPESFINDIPNDGTQIVIYCACPHAASGRVLNTLRRYGYENTAIIDEGILFWAQMGFPVRNGN